MSSERNSKSCQYHQLNTIPFLNTKTTIPTTSLMNPKEDVSKTIIIIMTIITQNRITIITGIKAHITSLDRNQDPDLNSESTQLLLKTILNSKVGKNTIPW